MALASMLATPALAEPLNYNVLEFNESASVRVAQDTMNVVLRVTETGKSRQEVSNKVTRRVNAILARAKGNKAFDIESGNRQTYPEYDDNRKIKGWTDTADIRISSQDFDALSKLAADSQNEAMLDGLSFSVSNAKYGAAVERASQEALKAFQQRALSVSRSLGFSGYKIVNIQLNQSFENEAAGVMLAAPMAASAKMRSYSADVMQTSAGEQEVRQTVRASVQMY